MQTALRDFRLQKIPNDAGNILASGNLAFQFGNFIVQVAMIHALGDFALQNLFQFLEIEDHAGCRVGFTRHSDFQRVVVSVAVRVVALAEDPLVLLRAHGRVVVEMGCGKLNFSRQVDHVFAIALMPHSMLGGYLQDTLSLSMPESLFGERDRRPRVPRRTAIYRGGHTR